LSSTRIFELLVANKINIALVAGVNLFANYLLLSHRRKYKSIIAEFERRTQEKITQRTRFALGYIICSILLLVTLILI
jgi:hypothetical protein